MDKLLVLSHELNVSLDSLMATEIAREKAAEPDMVTGTITLSSPHEHVVVKCSKVMSSPKFKGGKKSPQYALFASRDDALSIWGAPPKTLLGWYANAESLEKEIAAIQDAIFRGLPTYELQYSVRVEWKFFRVKILDD